MFVCIEHFSFRLYAVRWHAKDPFNLLIIALGNQMMFNFHYVNGIFSLMDFAIHCANAGRILNSIIV